MRQHFFKKISPRPLAGRKPAAQRAPDGQQGAQRAEKAPKAEGGAVSVALIIGYNALAFIKLALYIAEHSARSGLGGAEVPVGIAEKGGAPGAGHGPGLQVVGVDEAGEGVLKGEAVEAPHQGCRQPGANAAIAEVGIGPDVVALKIQAADGPRLQEVDVAAGYGPLNVLRTTKPLLYGQAGVCQLVQERIGRLLAT